ncbi:MAG: hypothetical protein KDD42_05115 [Bdellovibrionales bacterium]|nr:hypothetical protein [Bdellovibrionales bacterium]
MITREQLINQVEEEVRLVKHLATKVQTHHLQYRPAPKMRTVLETLQYLSVCGIAGLKAGLSSNPELIAAYSEQAKQVTLESFPAAIDRSLNELKEIVAAHTDEELLKKQVKLPWGITHTLAYTIINTTVRFLTAYRMQLFLYLKSAGVSELNTMNCWGGRDSMPPT